jgi:hypothetical protein
MKLVLSRRKFGAGIVGLVSFAVVFLAWFRPDQEGRTGLRQADDLFNRLSKGSACHIPALRHEAASLGERGFLCYVEAPAPGDAARIASLARRGQAAVELAEHGVHVRGRLQLLAAALLDDAEMLFAGQERELSAKYGGLMGAKEVVYHWWLICEPVYKAYISKGDIPASNLTSALRTRACEPAYNFAGIPPTPVADAAWPLAGLLGFYVLYTVWYGFSIMFLCEGLGLAARKAEKKE